MTKPCAFNRTPFQMALPTIRIPKSKVGQTTTDRLPPEKYFNTWSTGCGKNFLDGQNEDIQKMEKKGEWTNIIKPSKDRNRGLLERKIIVLNKYALNQIQRHIIIRQGKSVYDGNELY